MTKKNTYKGLLISSALFGQKILINATSQYNRNLICNGEADLGINCWNVKSDKGLTFLATTNSQPYGNTQLPRINGNYFYLNDTDTGTRSWAEMYQEIDITNYPDHSFIFSAYTLFNIAQEFSIELYAGNTFLEEVKETLESGLSEADIAAVMPQWIQITKTISTSSEADKLAVRIHLPKTPSLDTNAYQAYFGVDKLSLTALKPPKAAEPSSVMKISTENYIPRQILPIENKTIPLSHEIFDFSISKYTFIDLDNATLIIWATMSDGSTLLPWIQFDKSALKFSILPMFNALGNHSVRLTASDKISNCSVDFMLSIVMHGNPETVRILELPDNIKTQLTILIIALCILMVTLGILGLESRLTDIIDFAKKKIKTFNIKDIEAQRNTSLENPPRKLTNNSPDSSASMPGFDSDISASSSARENSKTNTPPGSSTSDIFAQLQNAANYEHTSQYSITESSNTTKDSSSQRSDEGSNYGNNSNSSISSSSFISTNQSNEPPFKANNTRNVFSS